MRLLKRCLPVAASGAIVALLVGGPAQSQTPTSASIVASDNKFRTADGGPPIVTIAPAGRVAFSYAGGGNPHNVVFTGTQPSSCSLTTGPGSGPVPPLPNSATSSSWSGECTFAAVGSYMFVCDIHSNMTGSVTVADPGGTTTTTPTTTTPTTTTPPAPPPAPPPVSPPPPPGPGTGPAASALRVTAAQRGFSVRGSVQVRSTRSRLLARAFARRRALSGGSSARQVQVGRQLRQSVGGARVTFGVALNAAARRALRRNGRLAISLRLTVTPPSGSAYTATRTVILRPAR